MAGEFIPFSSTLRSKLSTASSGASQFVSIAPGSTTTTISPSQSPTAPTPAATHSHQGISVDLKREGDRISQIRIQCHCGEVIELDCEY